MSNQISVKSYSVVFIKNNQLKQRNVSLFSDETTKLEDLIKYPIISTTPLPSCDGCRDESPKQLDHMGYFGCLNK